MAIGRSAALLRGLSLPQPLDGSTPAIELADLHKHKRRAQVLPAVIFEGQVISESTRALVRSGAFTSTQAEQRGSFWVQQPIDMIILRHVSTEKNKHLCWSARVYDTYFG